jgi:hypothetical protein
MPKTHIIPRMKEKKAKAFKIPKVMVIPPCLIKPDLSPPALQKVNLPINRVNT